MDAEDAAVIQAVLTGDVDRYAELVDRYQQRAIRMAFSLLGNRDDAREAAQEAFISAYRGLAAFRGGSKFSTWLFRIVINKSRDSLRRRQRVPFQARVGTPEADDDGDLFIDVPDDSADPKARASDREFSRALSRSIGALSMKQRTAFVLHHLHGLPLEDVAGIMGCRVGTVKTHVFRAMEVLRSDLSHWRGEAH